MGLKVSSFRLMPIFSAMQCKSDSSRTVLAAVDGSGGQKRIGRVSLLVEQGAFAFVRE